MSDLKNQIDKVEKSKVNKLTDKLIDKLEEDVKLQVQRNIRTEQLIDNVITKLKEYLQQDNIEALQAYTGILSRLNNVKVQSLDSVNALFSPSKGGDNSPLTIILNNNQSETVINNSSSPKQIDNFNLNELSQILQAAETVVKEYEIIDVTPENL